MRWRVVSLASLHHTLGSLGSLVSVLVRTPRGRGCEQCLVNCPTFKPTWAVKKLITSHVFLLRHGGRRRRNIEFLLGLRGILRWGTQLDLSLTVASPPPLRQLAALYYWQPKEIWEGGQSRAPLMQLLDDLSHGPRVNG